MSDTGNRRRRWPWLILALGLLVIGVPLVWRLRPLNATERALVGSWSCDAPKAELQFSPYHQFQGAIFWKLDVPQLRGELQETVHGATWSATNSRIEIRHSRLKLSNIRQYGFRWVLQDILTGGELRVMKLQVDGPDKIIVEGHEFRRVSSQPPR